MGHWYPCCPDIEIPCDICSADADAISVTLSGIENASCDCSWLNATFILARAGPGESLWPDSCLWLTSGKFICSYGATGEYSIRAKAEAVITPIGVSRYGWHVSIRVGVFPRHIDWVEFAWVNTVSGVFDCTATRTLMHKSTVAGQPHCLASSWDAASCQIN